MRSTVALASITALAAASVGCGGGDGAAGGGDAGIDTDDGLGCDGGRLDEASDLCWQHPLAPAYYAWSDAVAYCDALDAGGHDDWALPTRDELMGLLGGCDAAIAGGGNGYCAACAESDACRALFGADGEWYWSATPYDAGSAWLAHFDDGYLNRSDTGYAFYVRCVRAELP
jgi:hypothetical protein